MINSTNLHSIVIVRAPRPLLTHLAKKQLLILQLRTEIIQVLYHPTSIACLLDSNAKIKYPFLSVLIQRIFAKLPLLLSCSGGSEQFIRLLGSLLSLYSNVTTGGNAKYVSRRDMLANNVVDNCVNILSKAILAEEESNFIKNHKRARSQVNKDLQSNNLIPTAPSLEDITKIDKSPSFSILSSVHFFSSIIVEDIITESKRLFLRSIDTHFIIVKSTLQGRTITVKKEFTELEKLHKELVKKPTGKVDSLPFIEIYSTSKKKFLLDKLNHYFNVLLNQTPSSALRDFLGQYTILVNSSTDSLNDKSTIDNSSSISDNSNSNSNNSIKDEIKLKSRSEESVEEDARILIESLEQFRDFLMAPNGFKHLINTINKNHDIIDLPLYLQRVVDWWIICGAATMHRVFITDERALENFRKLKSFHDRAPYLTYIAILKSTNPVMIMKVISSIILAKPFGSQSFLQSTISGLLKDEITASHNDIKFYLNLMKGNNDIFLKIQEVVEKSPLSGYRPEEYPSKIAYILNIPIDKLDNKSIEYDAVEKMLDLYWNIIRQRQMMSIVKSDVFVEFIHAIISIVYKPLVEAYRVTDPGSFIRDIQKVIDDLVAIVKKLQSKILASIEAKEQVKWPSLMPFINLFSKHRHKIYGDIHRSFSGHPIYLPAFKSLGDYINSITLFLKGNGPTIPIMELLITNCKNKEDSEKLERDLLKLIMRKYLRNTRRSDRMKRRLRGEFSGLTIVDETLPIGDVNPFPNNLSDISYQKPQSSNNNNNSEEPEIGDYYVSLGNDLLAHHFEETLKPNNKKSNTKYKKDIKGCGNLVSPQIHIRIYPPGKELLQEDLNIISLFDEKNDLKKKKEIDNIDNEENNEETKMDIVEFSLKIDPNDLSVFHSYKNGWNKFINHKKTNSNENINQSKDKYAKGTFPSNVSISISREDAEKRYNLHKIQLEKFKVEGENMDVNISDISHTDIDNVSDIIGEDIKDVDNHKINDSNNDIMTEKEVEAGLRSIFTGSTQNKKEKEKENESDINLNENYHELPLNNLSKDFNELKINQDNNNNIFNEKMQWKDELFLEYLPNLNNKFMIEIQPWIDNLWTNGLPHLKKNI